MKLERNVWCVEHEAMNGCRNLVPSVPDEFPSQESAEEKITRAISGHKYRVVKVKVTMEWGDE